MGAPPVLMLALSLMAYLNSRYNGATMNRTAMTMLAAQRAFFFLGLSVWEELVSH